MDDWWSDERVEVLARLALAVGRWARRRSHEVTDCPYKQQAGLRALFMEFHWMAGYAEQLRGDRPTFEPHWEPFTRAVFLDVVDLRAE